MNVIDSTAWLEYFVAGENAGLFAVATEKQRRTHRAHPQSVRSLQEDTPAAKHKSAGIWRGG